LQDKTLNSKDKREEKTKRSTLFFYKINGKQRVFGQSAYKRGNPQVGTGEVAVRDMLPLAKSRKGPFEGRRAGTAVNAEDKGKNTMEKCS